MLIMPTVSASAIVALHATLTLAAVLPGRAAVGNNGTAITASSTAAGTDATADAVADAFIDPGKFNSPVEGSNVGPLVTPVPFSFPSARPIDTSPPSTPSDGWPVYQGTADTSMAVVFFNNTSPDDVCYAIELSTSKMLSLHTQMAQYTDLSPCDFSRDTFQAGVLPGISVPANSTATIRFPLNQFHGAFTAIVNQARGNRYEITMNDPSNIGATWFNADFEFGLSNGTVRSSDPHLRTIDGRLALQGDRDVLAKCNAAWDRTSASDKALLLTASDNAGTFLTQAPGDEDALVSVRHNKNAPYAVKKFLQLDANLTGYVVPGSYGRGGDGSGEETQRMRVAADGFVMLVATQQISITAY